MFPLIWLKRGQNNMKLGKREKLLVFSLLALVYVFVFAKFVIMPAIPNVKDVNLRISMVQNKIDKYNKDLLTIYAKKAEMDSLSANNERLNTYLLESADMADAFEYLDNLSNIVGLMDKVTINYPVLRSTTTGLDGDVSKGAQPNTQVTNGFYEIKISNQIKLTQQQVMDLIKYIEGGSLKVRISKLTMKPSTQTSELKQVQQMIGKSGTGDTVQPMPKNQIFDINMDICLYSMNPELTDKLYDYSRFKFNRYKENSGMLFTSTLSGGTDNSLASEESSRPLIEIKEGSFMAVGPNIEIIGADKSNDILRVRTKEAQDIKITMNGSSFTIESKDEAGMPISLSGAIPDKDMEIYVATNFDQISANENLYLNINLTNNTGKQVKITLSDSNKRVKITDRNGSPIISTSDSEKAYIS